MRLWGWVLMISLLVAGCVQPPEIHSPPVVPDHHAVVVAYLDSGINPYHVAFQRPRETVLGQLRELHLEPDPLRLTQVGDYETRLRADNATWESLQREHLYWIEGTNILAIAMDPEGTDGYHPAILDSEFHGTAIASVLTRADPSAILVSVQVSPLSLDNKTGGLMPPWLAHAVDWVAEQPWIDVVFMSKNGRGNVDDPSYNALAAATHRLVEAGKVVVGAAGNDVGPQWTDPWNGPPWIIAAGGVENSTRGSNVIASRNPDVVATFTNQIAVHDSTDAWAWSSGTSYSSPLVAGTVSNALRELRERNGWTTHDTRLGLARGPHAPITAPDVRSALNASAVYFNTTDYAATRDPYLFVHNGTPGDAFNLVYSLSMPVSVTPWVEMGWGYIGPEMSRSLAATLEGQTPPPKPAAALAYLNEIHAAREQYWLQAGPQD